MKVTYRFGVRVKDCEEQFSDEKHGFEPGEIMFQEVEYDLDSEADLNSGMFYKALMEQQDRIMSEAVEVTLTMVEKDGETVNDGPHVMPSRTFP